ncbi:MAG: Uma2 family endonuclease, partial [Vicinamibacterales bacterium]
YPDVTIVCGPWQRDLDDANAVTNPTLIVEVLSQSTEDYDRGDKFEHYKTLPTLSEYVLVSHRERSIEVFARDREGTWTCSTSRAGEVARLASIGARLDVDELYEAATEPTG